jgi:hypothetical protein
MNALARKICDKTSHFRDTAPVFRIKTRPLDESEALAVELATRVLGSDRCKAHKKRREGQSDLLLPEGVRATVFHASRAISVKSHIAPMEQLFEDHADRDKLTQWTREAAERTGLDRLVGRHESLTFERLWQIKASGTNAEGVRSDIVLCRAIGAFRRFLHDLPVMGRASAFVEITGRGKVSSAGLDWRTIAEEPIDHVTVIDPEQAAIAVVNDLNSRLGGGAFAEDAFDVGGFDLGYLSLPKRQAQSVFAPVYVARLERRGWQTMNYLVVVNGSQSTHAEICRARRSPPEDAIRRRGAGVDRDRCSRC